MKTKGIKTLMICATANVATMALCHGIFGYENLREISQLYRHLEGAGIGDFNTATKQIVTFARSDGMNLAGGLEKPLEWTRKYVALYPPTEKESFHGEVGLGSIEEYRKQIFAYLAFKGDARDLEVVKRFDSDILGALLEQRVAGVNIFDFDKDKFKPLRFAWRPKRFFPSVANTGPQAVYVHEILYRYWEETGRDSSKIPNELLTMVVSFDANDIPISSADLAKYGLAGRPVPQGVTPVSSVNLAKYGLSMPIIDPKPSWSMFSFYNEGVVSSWDKPGKFTVKFPDLAEPVEITLDMDRHSPDWKGLYKPRPTVPPPPTEDGRDAPQPPTEPQPPTTVATNDTPPPPEPVAEKPAPWKLPLLIGVCLLATLGGAIVWRKAKQK